MVEVEVTVVVVQVPPAVSEVRRLAVSRRRLWHLLCADARAVRLSVFSRAGLQQPCAVQRVRRHARVHVLCANLGIQTCHRLPCLQTPLRREGLAAMWMGRGLCPSLSLAARRMWRLMTGAHAPGAGARAIARDAGLGCAG